MKPYYERDGVTIYCGDCREILPELDRVNLTLTDPPCESREREVVVDNARALQLWAETSALLRADRLLLWLAICADPRRWLAPLADTTAARNG